MMRNKRGVPAIAGLCVVVAGLMLALGCERPAGNREGEVRGGAGQATQQAARPDAAATRTEGARTEAGAAGAAAGESRTAEKPAPAAPAPAPAASGSEPKPAAAPEAAQKPTEPAPSGKVVDGVRVVEVAARQFEFDPNTIVVGQGEKVRLEVTSKDVTHGFGLAAYGINQVLPPGETQKIEFTADKAGTFPFQCTIYCGAGHNDMRGQLAVRGTSQ
jgi:cytochrome c oxidase subunit 2